MGALARAAERRLGPFSSLAPVKTCKVDLAEISTAAVGIAWAFSFAGRLSTSVLETTHEAVTDIGHTLDALQAKKVAQTSICVDGPGIVASD